MAEGDFNVKAIISADTKNFDNGMKKAQTSATNLSNTFGNLSKVITKALSFAGLTVGVKAITDFGKASVKAAEDANKSLNILNNTLKVTGATAWTTSEEMVEMSKKIAGSTNYTVGEIQDMQSVLLGFKNITEETFEDASVAITDMATVMGMDLKSAVQTVGKALDDPIKGLDSLKRQGFAFTDQQKEEMKILVENGKILEAQNMILSELNTTYGGAAVAAQSSFDKQRDAMIELKETLGNQLLPIMERWVGESTKTFGKLIELVQKIDFASIAAGFEIAADTIKDIIVTVWENFKELFSALQEAFGDAEGIFDSWKESAWESFNNVYRIFQDVVKLITAIIKGDWSVAWSYAKLTILRMVDSALDNLSKLLNAFPKMVNTLISGLNEIIKGINVLRKLLDMGEIDLIKPFKSVDLSALSGVEDKIKETEKEIEKATGAAADKVIKDIDRVSDRRKKYIKESKKDNLDLKDNTDISTTKMENSWTKYFKKIKEKAKKWDEVISDIVGTIGQALQDMFAELGAQLIESERGWKKFASIAIKAVADIINALGQQLTVMAAAKALSHNYSEAAIAAAEATAAFIASGVLSAIAESMEEVADAVENAVENMTSAAEAAQKLKAAFEDLKSTFTKTPDAISGTVHQAKELLTTAEKLNSEVGDKLLNKIKKISMLNLMYKSMLTLTGGDVQEALKRVVEYFKQNTNRFIGTMSAKELDELGDLANGYINSLEEIVSLNELIDTAYTQVLDNLKAQNKELDFTVESYNELYDSMKDVSELQAQLTYFEGLSKIPGYSGASKVAEQLRSELELYKKQYQILLEEQKTTIKKALTDVYSTIASSGSQIGENLVSSIISGAKKEDFLTSMKSYIRENLIKLAVYTESFQEKLAEIGTKLSAALVGGKNLTSIRKELESIWEEASESAKKVELVISNVFGDLAEETEESLEKIEKELTRFEKAMNSFKDTISDLGGDLASNLVEGIANGLSQGDFLDDMKKWIRKMLVQSVVYTESMKTEIEAIGAAISKGISEGFTETTFHEIRRDLSWVFEQANRTMENIDGILNSVFGSGYATGTNNATSGLHLVGEAGPELVKFRGGEQVLNAGNTQKALSGIGNSNTFNVTFQNTKDTTAYAMMQQLKSYNRQMAINGII